MKIRPPFRAAFVRSYATRLPERPPYRAPDPLINNPHATYQALPEDLTFIHRPPPTAPSPESYTTAPASPLLRPAGPAADALPPTLRTETPSPPRASDQVLQQIRKLRLEDPEKWTRTRLSKEFGCTPGFVGRVASLKVADRKKVLRKRDQEHAQARAQWGERKAFVADARKKRREFW
ncbi:mitochondrial ribosomal protein subunit L20-domain-containing protein [Amylocystis lapponica]|nr:mitochondrial ribosomal protein subunit L20-domain-containing protein [Amylocystis lapponica]